MTTKQQTGSVHASLAYPAIAGMISSPKWAEP
jgi:hypothetical protein